MKFDAADKNTYNNNFVYTPMLCDQYFHDNISIVT